ncbi:MAG: Gfo/Idh/MocA family oxidoreductase [Chitinophagaceae bacterium]|nr:MAG: Gfo/Idh/MocA family oxidoreductase [Chitinophagaceae bacterium]
MLKSITKYMTEIKKDLSRKQFINITGKTLAVGGVLASGIVEAQTRQNGKKAQSPPARVPASAQEPIKLEAWKSDADPASAPTPTPLPEDQRVGYAVVGLGHLTLEEILPALSQCEKSKLVALVSGSPEKLKKVGEQYGVTPENRYSYENFDTIRNNKQVEIVYIVLPNGLHKEYVIRTAKAGKHILCEKPMANTADECRAMIAACDDAKVKLMVAYRIHYQPHNRYVREQIKKKTFGNVKFVEATNSQSSANKDHWRHKKALAGGGALPDIGLYCLNTTRFILSEEPTEVFAYQFSTPGNPLFTEVEEIMSWQMKFPSGIIANCSTNYFVHESRRYRVMSERGWYDIENAYAYKGQQLKTSRADGKLKIQETIVVPENNQFGAEMDYFSDCIMNDKRPFSTGEEGLQDHLIMEAIYQSAKEGRPISLKSSPSYDSLHGPEVVI